MTTHFSGAQNRRLLLFDDEGTLDAREIGAIAVALDVTSKTKIPSARHANY